MTSGQISEGGKQSRASIGKRVSGRRSSRCEIPEEENAKYVGVCEEAGVGGRSGQFQRDGRRESEQRGLL